MKKSVTCLTLAGLAALFLSCSNPLAPVAPEGSVATAPTLPFAVGTDAARNQGYFVDESGTRIDIRAVEPDGSVVSCVKAVGVAAPQAEGARAADGPATVMKAIVVGMRADGNPGMWVVTADRTVHPGCEDESGGATSLLPESHDRDRGLGRAQGWTYVVTGISSDGRIAIGVATNANGITRGPYSIEPGTTVGVYWKLSRKAGHHAVSVSHARVIGTIDLASLPQRKRHRPPTIDPHLMKALDKLVLFFKGYFDQYLISADSVSLDSSSNHYAVHGMDQDGNPAIATIDMRGLITIEAIPVPSQPDLVVTSIRVPSAPQAKDATWLLGAEVTNNGGETAGPSLVRYQLSTSSILDATATTIGEHDVPELAPGESYPDTWSDSYSIPQSGTYWIFVTADAASQVAEASEANNTSTARVLISYERIVIETYQPVVEGEGSYAADTFISLFGASGDTTVDLPDVWNSNKPPYTAETSAIVEDSGDGLWAVIDRANLAPGTYYVRVRQARSDEGGTGYAIRFLSLTGTHPAPAHTYFSSNNTADEPYEPDDDPQSGGVPTNPVIAAMGDVFNRYIGSGTASPVAGDVDWFTFTLP